MKSISEPFPLSDCDPRRMRPSKCEWTEFVARIGEPRAVLTEVVAALQILNAETASSLATPTSLIDLHGALLLFELGGQRELIPSVPLGVSTRRGLERRVTQAARVLAGRDHPDGAAYEAWTRAAARIEDLIDLIDPELRITVAS